MDKIEDFLKAAGFQVTSADQWQHRFDYPATGEYVITVDTDKRTIDYPKPILLDDRTTSNFDHLENFVVLECVCRLLAKGYDPATLVLEKRYQVGRGASGGKSDVTVLRRTPDATEQTNAPPLLIIECKTWGPEHDAERQKTLETGGQVFGYLQQDRAATHLCIYSSRLNDAGVIEYRSDIIRVDDTPEAQEKFDKKEKSENHTAARDAVPLFRHAHNRESLHHAWKTTYGAAFQSSGLFEDDFTPYAIGYLPLRGKDLKEFNGENGSTKVFSQFMEILRHNNVSDKENAFNRLCAIILAKLIDEERASDAILDFQWFPDKDTPEDLIDRLQRLFKRGMKETLGEDVTYVEERDIDQAFQAHRRDAAKNRIKQYFRALKFYTNSDFAFKEVHNKKLFEQNTQVVKEIVELFQGYRLKYTSKQAFLGNLFELLLNSGFKQNEGQFFTPIPIARFIVRCLPLRERMHAAQAAGRQQIIPRMMDYACGSAHFLTEIIEEVQEDLDALSLPEAANTRWTRDYVWGIEKDYRLARTAKIALFLHGAGDANILHEDGLDHANPALPKVGELDVLVANPPYSVKDFKQHLRLDPQQQARFSLLPHLTSNSSEIEALFVERAAQLLRTGGLAGLILPSSILSNAGIYQRTRALILEKFLLRGIVELGGSAFIATGTNTVILFLERRDDIHLEHFTFRADALYNDEKTARDNDFADSDLLTAYTAAAGLPFAAYRDWLAATDGEPSEELEQTELFRAYAREFDDLHATQARKKQKSFQKLDNDQQQAEMRGKLLQYIREAEREKFIYFALAHVEHLEEGEIVPQRTTVVRGAGSKKEEQNFLGYKWSNRRGSEGMEYLRDPFDGGALYTPREDYRVDNPAKMAHYLRSAFLGTSCDVTADGLELNAKLGLSFTPAYIDFTQTKCNLAVNLSIASQAESPAFLTQHPLVRLGDVAAILGGGTPDTKNPKYWNGDIPWLTVADFRGRHRYVDFAEKTITKEGLMNSNAQVLDVGDLIISARGTVGEVAQLAKPMAFNQSCYGLRGNENLDNGYLLYALRICRGQLVARSSGATFGSITTNLLEQLRLPLPPLDVQTKLIRKIEQIETEETQAREQAEQARETINAIVRRCYESDAPRRTIKSLSTLVQYGLSKAMNEDGIGYKIFRMNEVIDGRMMDNGSMKYVDIDADEFATYRLDKGDVLFNRTNGSIDQVGKTGLFDLDGDYCCASYLVRVVPGPDIKSPLLVAFMNSAAFLTEIRKQAIRSAGQNNINATKMKNMEVPVPSLPEQQALLNEIAEHERKLADAEAVLAAAPARKRQILLDGIK